MKLTELDTIRADTMRELLNKEGQKEIWKYDIATRRQALNEARYNYDFDNMEFGRKSDKSYALIGPGICDTYFETTGELKKAVRWLCCDSYLGCYKNI